MRDELPLGTRILAGAAGALVPGLLDLYFSTCRVHLVGPDLERERIGGRPPVGAILHKHFLFVAHHFRDRRCVVIVSRSKDGEIITRACERMGTIVVRGSSSRGGAQGLLRLIDYGRRGYPISIIVDGPRGPAGVSKMGVVIAAKETGNPILPLGIVAESAFEFDNWDRTAIPRPYSRIAIRYGDPVEVPHDASPGECERIRLGVDAEFVRLEAELREYLARRRR
ncbi:MAG: lysophospholipid acyltransferase family protein [Planctomycetes bacterium]|nr:lysophospholipid acyltransferase family protein [Planctomycetota bacterium]